MYGPLPGMRLAWTAYAEANPFVNYTLQRRARRSILDGDETAPLTYPAGQKMLPTANLFDGFRGAVAVRFSFPWNNASEPGGGTGTPTVWRYWQDANNYLWLFYNEATNVYRFTRMVAGVSVSADVAATVTTGALVTAIAYWTPTGIGLSVNGATFVTAATGSGAIRPADQFDVGTAGGASPSSLTARWLATFAGVLTQADAVGLAALADAAFGDYAPSLDPLRALAVPSLPTGLWDGVSTTMYRVIPDPWVTLATIQDPTVNHYMDRRTRSGRVYEYTVTATANVYGSVMTSERQSPPLTASCTHEGVAIHNKNNESDYVIVTASAMQVTPAQEVSYIHARGRSKPSAQYGEMEADRITITPIFNHLTERDDWDLLRRFLTAQRTQGATFCVRPGHAAERWYAQLDKLERDDHGVQAQNSVEMQEVFVDEESSS